MPDADGNVNTRLICRGKTSYQLTSGWIDPGIGRDRRVSGGQDGAVAGPEKLYVDRIGEIMAEVFDKEAENMEKAAAVLAAANIADELFKAQAAAEQLRSQIKGYLDEAGKAQAEASELRREVFRLQQKLNQHK